jgi:hypothetical protein
VGGVRGETRCRWGGGGGRCWPNSLIFFAGVMESMAGGILIHMGLVSFLAGAFVYTSLTPAPHFPPPASRQLHFCFRTAPPQLCLLCASSHVICCTAELLVGTTSSHHIALSILCLGAAAVPLLSPASAVSTFGSNSFHPHQICGACRPSPVQPDLTLSVTYRPHPSCRGFPPQRTRPVAGQPPPPVEDEGAAPTPPDGDEGERLS